MKAPPLLTTARLALSAPEARDADAIFERFAGDPEVTRYMSWPRHRSLEDTRAFLSFSASQWQRRDAGPYLIRAREDDRLLGATGLQIDGPGEAVTGYVLAKDAWGQGYATEALQAMVDLARTIGLARLTALCHHEHRASQRVLEKCGFERERRMRRSDFPNLAPGVRQDALCYTLRLHPD
jgi:RimJ/RimL family protein N-acetyltransferase